MGKKHAQEMLFWTKNEFQMFIDEVMDKQTMYVIFMMFYWTGIRLGELLALTPADIDFDKKTISINKSYQRIEKEDVITEPKTPKSKRIITAPNVLIEAIKGYTKLYYDCDLDAPLFPISKNYIERELQKGVKKSVLRKYVFMISDIVMHHYSLI